MMPPLKSLGSVVVAQVGRSVGRRRNFSSSTDSRSDVKIGLARFAVRVIPFFVGYGVAGPIIFGEKVSLLEEQRQHEWRKIYGDAAEEIGDVRDMVVPGLGEIVYSYLSGNAARWWSAKRMWWSAKRT